MTQSEQTLAHLAQPDESTWTTEVHYTVHYRYCGPDDPFYGQHDVINIEPTGVAGFHSAREVANRLEVPLFIRNGVDPDRRVQVHDMVEIFTYTTMRSPEKWVSRDG